MIVLIPLVLGIMQVGFVLHIRNTLTSAASEAARQAAAVDGTPAEGERRAYVLVRDAVGAEYATQIDADQTTVDGYPAIEVRIEASVPALGVFGPSVHVAVEGHAVEERAS